eukprot:3045052-Amphidinium_carterae.1
MVLDLNIVPGEVLPADACWISLKMVARQLGVWVIALVIVNIVYSATFGRSSCLSFGRALPQGEALRQAGHSLQKRSRKRRTTFRYCTIS